MPVQCTTRTFSTAITTPKAAVIAAPARLRATDAPRRRNATQPITARITIPDSIAAQAGLVAGEEIVSVDGKAVTGWNQVNLQLVRRLGESGALLVGVFAAPGLGGTGAEDFSIASQLLIQAEGVVITMLWSGVVAFICYKIVDMVMGLRVSEEAEREGLDITSHGETAYNR